MTAGWRQIWEVSNSAVFIIEGEIKNYVAYIDLERIEWERPDEIVVMIKGCLPTASYLVTMPHGVILEIQNRKCGRLDFYDDKSTIIKVVNCKVNKRWIEHPVSKRPNYDYVEIFVELIGTGIEFPQSAIEGKQNEQGK